MMPAVTVTTLLTALLLANSAARPQQQQLFYYPPAQQPTSYYYLPQAALPSYQPLPMSPARAASPGQYMVFYTGYPNLPPHQAPFIVHQQPTEEGVSRPASWWQTVVQAFGGEVPPVVAPVEETTPTVVTPAEETTPSSAAPEKPEKVVEEMMVAVEQNLGDHPASLEDLGDEPDLGGGDEPEYGGGGGVEGETVEDAVVARPTGTPASSGGAATHKFVAVHEPQFFGSYDFLMRGQQVGQNPAGSNFLLFRNQPRPFQFPQLAPPFSYSHHQTPLLKSVHEPQTQTQERSGAYIPGQRHVDISAAFPQRFVTSHAAQPPLERGSIPTKQQEQAAQHGVQEFQSAPGQPGLVNVGPGYQNVYFITRQEEQDKVKKEEASASSNVTTVVEEEQAGPSVAQAKPQAIAIAGVGGVAAATPVATAVAGPGGLAVSAPTATAVAGVTSPGQVTGPAAAVVNKYLTTGKKPGVAHDEQDSRGIVAYSL